MDTLPEPHCVPTPSSHAAPLTAPYAMQGRYGWFLRKLLSWLFAPIHYPAQSAERVREMAQKGVLVYVTRGHSAWLALCFNYILARMGLPLASFVGGVNFCWLQPIGRLWRVFRERQRPAGGPWLQRAGKQRVTRNENILIEHILRGESAFFALPMPRGSRGDTPDLNDYVRALILAQRHMTRPVLLAPHILIDREQSGAAYKSILDRIFGDRRRPGGIRRVAMLLTLRHGIVRMADPVNLHSYIYENPEMDDVMLARKVRHDLQRRMSEEERVVAGPRLSMYDTTARHVMRDPLVRAAIISENARTGKSDVVLESEAQHHLRGIAARYNVRYIKVMSKLLNQLFNRIYDGIAVDEAGLSRVIEASRRGPLVFCPSHRSHIDYLVLSFVLWGHRIAPPHIAAGANLSFFPLGPLFRHSGAFFLRRTFGDDPLYAAVFRAYIVELIKHGTAIEFFLEGTRSRSGKLLMPKFGILGMLADAWRRGAREDLQFVPVSIDYERIIEARSYERELKGADKRTENIGGLLRTTKVLRSRYGRVQVQFGEAISLASLAAQHQLPQSEAPQADGPWRLEVERLGFRILHSVAMVCSATPTAVVSTALLGHPSRGMAQNTLLERCEAIVAFLEGAAARLSLPLQHADTRTSAVLEAVQKFVDEGVVAVDRAGRSDMEPIYRVPDESRTVLDYHKNAVMNYFAPAALVARAIVKQGDVKHIDYAAIHSGTRFLSRLFKREFIYRVDSTFETYFDETLGALAIRGFLDVIDDSTIVVRQPETLNLLSGLVDSFIQAYSVTAQTLLYLRAFPLWHKELVTRTLERTRRAFLEGHITRPEAANRSLVETALQWMIETEVVQVQMSGKRKTLQLSSTFGPEKLQQLIDDIARYL